MKRAGRAIANVFDWVVDVLRDVWDGIASEPTLVALWVLVVVVALCR